MAHSVSHELTAPPPLFSFLKTIQCLAVTFNLDSKCGTKNQHWCKQKCGVQFLNLTADFDDLCRLHPLSPEEALRTSRWGVGKLIAEMRMRTCNCLKLTSGLRRKRSTSCIFTFVSSSLKDKMHFTSLAQSFTNARERIGNFTPLGRRKIEFYGKLVYKAF